MRQGSHSSQICWKAPNFVEEFSGQDWKVRVLSDFFVACPGNHVTEGPSHRRSWKSMLTRDKNCVHVSDGPFFSGSLEFLRTCTYVLFFVCLLVSFDLAWSLENLHTSLKRERIRTHLRDEYIKEAITGAIV